MLALSAAVLALSAAVLAVLAAFLKFFSCKDAALLDAVRALFNTFVTFLDAVSAFFIARLAC